MARLSNTSRLLHPKRAVLKPSVRSIEVILFLISVTESWTQSFLSWDLPRAQTSQSFWTAVIRAALCVHLTSTAPFTSTTTSMVSATGRFWSWCFKRQITTPVGVPMSQQLLRLGLQTCRPLWGLQRAKIMKWQRSTMSKCLTLCHEVCLGRRGHRVSDSTGVLRGLWSKLWNLKREGQQHTNLSSQSSSAVWDPRRCLSPLERERRPGCGLRIALPQQGTICRIVEDGMMEQRLRCRLCDSCNILRFLLLPSKAFSSTIIGLCSSSLDFPIQHTNSMSLLCCYDTIWFVGLMNCSEFKLCLRPQQDIWINFLSRILGLYLCCVVAVRDSVW